MVDLLSDRAISRVEIYPYDPRCARHDALRKYLFPATERSLVAWAGLVEEPRSCAIELWRVSNNRALEFAQYYLNDRYHMVRYEDLCRQPAETVSAVMAFLGQPETNIGPLIQGIRDRG